MTDAEFLDYLEQEVLPTAHTPDGFRTPVCILEYADRERMYELAGTNIKMSDKPLFDVDASSVQRYITTARNIILRRVTEKLTK